MISFNINWRKPFTMLGGFADTAIAFDYKYAPANFLDYYNKVAPVADAIDKLATLGSCIRPYGYIGKEASAEDDLFNMWARRPNSQQNGIQFRKEALVHFLVTGNNFVEVKYIKDKKKKVVKAITNINPRKITINIKGEEIDYYETTKYSKTVRYSKQLKTQDGFTDTTRYQYEENGYIYDLIQYREMEDSHVDIMTGFGRSRLEPLQDELQLYIQGNLSNKATFKNSLSAKKMLKIDTTKINSGINQEMINQYKDTLIKEFSGVENQGKTIITNLDVNPVDLQNPFMAKDLEFNVGLRRLRVAFYNAYNIQLPLVEGEFTSNSNMKEANLMLYDNGILPMLESYYEFNDFNLIRNFNPETKISEIKYVASEIPAIAMRDAELVNQISNANIATKNELRQKVGLNPIVGLNAVYIDGNQAPIGEDTNTGDSIGVPLSQVKELVFDDIEDYEIELLETEEKALSDINLIPTETMSNNAKRGLELREKFGRGGTAVGVARARDISNRKNLSPSTVARMVSFFARHGVNEGKNKLPNGDPSNHYIAWLLWGGNAGRTWANAKWNAIKREREK